MPNHCYQQVRVEGPNFLVRQLWDGLSGKDPQFCQLVVPMPFEQWISPKVKWRGFDVEGWYDWRCNNWGTKWDVVNVEIDEEFTREKGADDIFDENVKSWFEFRCWTAWGPPVPVWDKLRELGVRVHATYQDEGGMFEGEYINGVDLSWERIIEKKEAC